jgi:hypothetical protein
MYYGKLFLTPLLDQSKTALANDNENKGPTKATDGASLKPTWLPAANTMSILIYNVKI